MPRGSATRRAILLGAAGLGAGRGQGSAEAKEAPRLIFLERMDFPYCWRWLHDVGEQTWNRSDLGARAPLRRVDVAGGMPADMRFIANWRFTPAFVLLRGQAELGRIIGYNGDTFFWQQAESLIGLLARP